MQLSVLQNSNLENQVQGISATNQQQQAWKSNHLQDPIAEEIHKAPVKYYEKEYYVEKIIISYFRLLFATICYSLQFGK